MDIRRPFNQCLSLSLAGILFLNPLMGAAAQLAVDRAGDANTQVTAAGNGVPVVNIATPNDRGLSHNRFKDYNVGPSGVILNNARERLQPTQLGGIILGNPNLKGGSAHVILNEVNGGSPSQLRGYTEVAGQSAKVIVANPYGISCDGCGFINTPRVTLTTGQPVLDNGRLERYQVEGGAVTIDGRGLDARDVDRFEIITRSAKINAQINARQLTLITGPNEVNAKTLAATARAGGGARPELAIDSSALGGMYAGAIKLVGSEAGVGVRLAGALAASGGDIELDANGHLSLSRAAAGGAIKVKAARLDVQGPVHAGTALTAQAQGELRTRKTLAAGGSLTLSSGGRLTNSGLIEAGINADKTRNAQGDVRLAAQAFNNRGGRVAASRALTVEAGALNNQGGELSAKQHLRIAAGVLDNQNQGRVLSDASLDVSAARALNAQGGLIASGGPLSATVGELDNRGGELSSPGAVTLSAERLDNRAGKLISHGPLSLAGNQLVNQGGLISGWRGVGLQGQDLDNRDKGTVSSLHGRLEARLGGSLLNSGGGALVSQSALAVSAARLDNRDKGVLSSADRQTLAVSGLLDNAQGGLIDSGAALELGAQTLNNAGGQVNARQALSLSGTALDNRGGALIGEGAVALDLLGALTNAHGKLASQGGLSLSAGSLDNRDRGVVAANDALVVTTAGAVRNRDGGLIHSQNAGLTLKAAGLDNAQGSIRGQSALSLDIGGALDNREGGLYTQGALKVSGSRFDNSGQVTGGRIDFALSGALSNQKGIIESDTTLKVAAASVDNQGGQLRALGDQGQSGFEIDGLLDNRDGVLEAANRDLTLNVGGFQNAGGRVLHAGAGAVEVDAARLSNAGGRLVTRGDLSLSAERWTNSSLIQAGRLTVNVDTLEQTATGQLLASDSFTGAGGHWSVNGLIASQGRLDLSLGGLFKSAGRLSSRGDLSLSAAQASLSKTASLVSGAHLVTRLQGDLDNHGRLSAASDLSLIAGSVNNRGTLAGGQALTAATGALLNEQGLIFSGADMSLRVDSLNNRDANIHSLGNLSIDRDGRGGLADSIINSSSTIQSDGHLSLAARVLENVRTVLKTGNPGIHTARIGEIACLEGINAGDCGGKRHHVWEVVQREKVEVTQASAASSISAGKNLALRGGDLLNASSLIGSGGDLSITVDKLTNRGVETGETETQRVFLSARTKNAAPWQSAARAFTDKYWFQSAGYNPEEVGGLPAALGNFIGMTEREWPQFRTTRKLAEGDQRYAAVIQAAGTAKVSVGNQIDNRVARPGYTYVGSGQKTDGQVSGAEFSTRITVNRQLPPDLAQQQVNPLSLPGFSLPTTQNGLFRLSGQDAAPAGPPRVDPAWELPESTVVSRPGHYLIETNPLLTRLKPFMSSDYLLSKLGYDPDQSWKRLGDGLYEEWLIRQAVVARTGQRFIDGQRSDAGQYQYLMDNAIASQQRLNLAVGVSLSAEQVAALTHDIVWLEPATVNGEQVLAPVLYLAQAQGRLGPNGALIAGGEVKLIGGQNLDNQGTLRAGQTLSARGARLVNSGLIQAGGRLDLQAGDALINRAGGIIAGGEVSLGAAGDVINERTRVSHQSGSGSRAERRDFVDSPARIEAAGSLSIQAGRDVKAVGAVLSSGADATLSAGRDVRLLAAEQRDADARGRFRRDDVAQYGNLIEAGRDFHVRAGRDIRAVASQVSAGRDLSLSAGRDLSVASAAAERHASFDSKKAASQQDHVQQVSSLLTAGGNLALSAAQDLTLTASRASAGHQAYLHAGGHLELLAAADSQYSLYDMRKKGGWGGKKTRRDEVTDVKAVGSEVSSGGALTLKSGGDQLYQGAKVASGADLTLDSGGAVTFEAVKDLHQESHAKSNSSLAWQSAKGQGHRDETLRQSQLLAQGNLTIKALDGLKIDLKQLDQKSIRQSIEAMVQADPRLAWLKAAEQRGDVSWRRVKELRERWKYSQAGLGPAAQLAVAIAASALGGMAAAGALSGTGAFVSAAGVGAAGSFSSTAALSLINHKGDLGQALKDSLGHDSLKQMAIASLTAGLTSEYFDGLLQTKTHPVTGKVATDLGSGIGIGRFAANQALQNATSSLLSQALGQGGRLNEALKNTLYNSFAAAGFNFAGDLGQAHGLPAGGGQMLALHALMGGLSAKISGGSFAAGAAAAGANEALVSQLDQAFKGLSPQKQDALLSLNSQLIGLLATAARNPQASAKELETGAWVAKNATQYNWLLHKEKEAADQAREDCKTLGGDVAACQRNITQAMDSLDKMRNFEMKEHARQAQLAAYLNGLTREEYNLVLHAYWNGVDKKEVTFSGYEPAREWGYLAQQFGAGFKEKAQSWPGAAFEKVKDTLTHLTDIPGNLYQAGKEAVDWVKSPIPAQSLERASDQLLLSTPEQLGGIVFDVAAGSITAAVGGKAFSWVGGKWIPTGKNLGEKAATQAVKNGAKGSSLAGQAIDELSSAGKMLDPADKSGQLSLAGRALQKHGSREGSAFPSVKGSPSEINAQGQKIADEILSNPASTITYKDTGRFGKVMDVVAPDGRGLRYDASGKFIGLLEPPKS